MRQYQYFPQSVRKVDLEFNFFGIRISILVMSIIMAIVIGAVVTLVVGNKMVPDDYYLFLVIGIVAISVILIMILIWWVTKLSRMGPLPVEKQFFLAKRTVDNMVAFNGVDDKVDPTVTRKKKSSKKKTKPKGKKKK